MGVPMDAYCAHYDTRENNKIHGDSNTLNLVLSQTK